ncbi:MAG: hypothetical protein IJW73_04920, partial [Candidatus Gastranaerophilales bacterium]|nr:hypothetical protein [Candidatus Gastranaerophilales bacterium]
MNISQISFLRQLKLNENNQKQSNVITSPVSKANYSNSLDLMANYNRFITFKGAISAETCDVKELFALSGEKSGNYSKLISSHSSVDAAIIASYGFDENQIKSYKNILETTIQYKDEQGNDREYKFNFLEAGYLVSRGIIDKEQLETYVEFKTTGVRLSGVRADNKRFELTSEEIVDAILVKRTLKDLEDEKRLYDLINKKIKPDVAARISKHPVLYSLAIEKDDKGNYVYPTSKIMEYFVYGLFEQAQIDEYNSKLSQGYPKRVAAAVAKGEVDKLKENEIVELT